MSREHVISKSVLGTGPFLARGLRIPSDQPLSISSLVANVLCDKHNSELSSLDEEVGRLSDACLNFKRLGSAAEVILDGRRIERWLLKLMVGVLASGWHGLKMPPHPDVVAAIFGLQPLPPNVAMFGIANIGKETSRDESVEWDYFFGSSGASVGLIVSIHGVPLLLSLFLDDAEGDLRMRGSIVGYDVSDARLRKHPTELVVRSKDDDLAKLSMKLRWSP